MNTEKSTVATNWADWVLNSGWRAIANQFDEQIDWYTVANESKAFNDNQEKCRYYNVGCFDWNRLVLKDRSPPHNDFYHANSVYLKGDEQFHVIAAQGPLYNTSEDLWELIYQEKVSTIVQLCNFTEGPERIRCSEYWPMKKSRTFGDLNVSLMMEDLIDEDIPDIQLRAFRVRKDGESEHSVRHIFYKKWPDYGVPQTVTPLISIVRWLEENGGMNKESPILVHCLAGIGRTGTLIASLMGLRHIRRLDAREDYSTLVMELAMELRRHRDGSIQTSQQYIYVHAAILKLLAMEGLIQSDDRLMDFRYVNPPLF
ncbi:hypothetical protein PENTCL1PPCAC_22594 [Pristionchus entomophagus]|uniref:Tyrosine phosphatase n=1 Tax=Pristionchus entomophagus TaxID=358040 RepID=A0AAV5U2I8_9BILA|nr:hypothetical protein PENTCL1PPCAC_22594 [Pristionchus entomophagus]